MYPINMDPISMVPSYSDMYDTKLVSKKNPEEKLIKEGYEIVTKKDTTYGRKFLEYGNESTHFVYNNLRNDKIIELAKQNKRVLILFSKMAQGDYLHKKLPGGRVTWVQ